MVAQEGSWTATLRRPQGLAAALFLVVGIACTVGPKYKKPEVPLNSGWSGKGDPRLATQTPVEQAWWKTFNDPTLEKLVGLAHRQNLPLQIAGLKIFETRALLGIAVARQYPTNDKPIASGSAGGFANSKQSLTYGQFQMGFDATWELDFWGKYRQGVSAAEAAYLATVADYEYAWVSLTAEVARTYFVIRTFQVLLALARDNVKVQEDGLQIAESRFRHGATSALDVDQATNLLETTRATIPELQIGLEQAQNALCTLIGQPTGCGQTLLAGAEIVPNAPASVAVSVPAELLRRRPDIRSAELNAIAQCDRIGVAKAELYPAFSLLGSLGAGVVGTSGSSSSFSSIVNLFNPGAFFYSIGATMFWPILSYPKILNNVRAEDARFQQSLFNYQYTVFKAAQEVEDGIVGYMREQEEAVNHQNAVAAAQDSVHIAVVQYREGAIDYQRVVDTERSLLQSQNSLARTRSAIVTNLVALYKGLGGGWELNQGQPVLTDATRDEMQKRTNWNNYLSQPLPETQPETGSSPEP